jgi:hypothetical protein
MSQQTTPESKNIAPDADDSELKAKLFVLKFFGGDKPINSATLYRGIKEGKFPRPVKIGPKTSRWLHGECKAAKQKLIDERAA